MAKCRVLHIIDSLNGGGTENRCLEIIAGLDAERFEPHLIYFDGSGILRPVVERLGIIHREIKAGGFFTTMFWKGLASIIRYMGDARIGLVQTYGFYSNVPGIVAAKIAGGLPIVVSRRDMGEFLTPGQRILEKWLWRFADRIAVNAAPIKDALVRVGIPACKLVVIQNGIDKAMLDWHSSNGIDPYPRVGMVANFRRQKDHITFLNAAAIVAAAKPDVRFLLVGSGPYEGVARDHAMKLGLENHVNFMGTRVGAALRRTVQSLTVSVLCSHNNEGLPNVVLEAMAAAKPVIATDVGGTREAIENGLSGFLVPPREPHALADKIMWLIDHPEASREMGLRGRRRVERQFSLSRMQEAFVDLYLEVLQQKGIQVP